MKNLNHLIKQIQLGDESAFKELTLLIENDLYRIAKTRLYSDDDIMDAIQNTMLITFKNSKKIKNIDSFKTWMIHVLINECNKIYNFNKKSTELYNKVIIDTNFDTFDNSIQNVQDTINFDSLINKLNYDEKIVITLYYNSQFSCKQISKILNTNINTIKSRLTRGKNKLKEYCKEVNYDKT